MQYLKSKIDLKQVKFSNLYEFVEILYNTFKDVKEVQDLAEFSRDHYDILINIKIKEPKRNSRFDLETQVPLLRHMYNNLREQGYTENEAVESLREGPVTEWLEAGELDRRYDIDGNPYTPNYDYVNKLPHPKSILYMVDPYYRDWRLSFRQFKEAMKKFKWDIDIKKVEDAVKHKLEPRKLKTLSEKVLGLSDEESFDVNDKPSSWSIEAVNRGNFALLTTPYEYRLVTRNYKGQFYANSKYRLWLSDAMDNHIKGLMIYDPDRKVYFMKKTINADKYYKIEQLANDLWRDYQKQLHGE